MKKKKFLQSKQGDSIIEVLLAVAIFSAIAVTSIAIMNKGLSSAQTALESTMVRTELDAQAEAIRFIEQAYETNAGGPIGRLWSTIVENAISPDTSTADSDYNKLKAAIDGNNACLASTELTGKYFLYNGSELESDLNLSTSSIPSVANGGLWIVAVQNKVLGAGESSKNIEYYDFYISACWDALNSSMPAKRTTIIRIHNPDYETTSGAPETPDYTLSLVVKFRSGFSSSTETWDLYKTSVLQKKNMAGIDEYGYTAKSKSWNDGETPPDVSEFEFNVDIFSAKREGWIFEGWSQEGGDLSAGYKCESSGVCSWESGEIIYRAKWKAADQFCLRFYDGATQIASLMDDCSSSSSFQNLPSYPKTGSILSGWNIDGTTYSIGQIPNITVTSTNYDGTDSPTNGATKYYKKAKAVWATMVASPIPTNALQTNKNNKSLLSITIRYNCVTFFGVCRDDTSKMRIIYPQIVNSNNKVIGTYGGAENTMSTSYNNLVDTAQLFRNSGNGLGKEYIKHTAFSSEVEVQLVINITDLEEGEYKIQLYNYHGTPTDNDLKFYKGIKVYIQSWGSDEGDGVQICSSEFSTTGTWCEPILTETPPNSQTWDLFKIKKDSDNLYFIGLQN